MQKILFMIGMMNVGGVEKSLLSLISTIPREKYEVTILLLEKRGELLKEIPHWVKVKEANWFEEIRPIILQSPYKTISNYFYNKQIFEIPRFALIQKISNKTNNRYFYYQSILRNVPELPESYDIAIAYQGPHDIIDFYIANKVTAKVKTSWVHFDVSKFKVNIKFYSKIYQKFDKIFVVSDEAHKKILQLIPNLEGKTEVFYNIFSKKTVNYLSKKSNCFDDDYKGLRIVTVGRLSKEKGLDIAINLLCRLRTDGYEVKWYCVGEGNHRAELERIINKKNMQNNFILLGSKINPYPYIRESDIYVQTSRHEGYCLTLAEAKCLNKPIVTTNFIGAYDQIVHGVNGYIECNEDDLYHRIKYLLDDPNKRLELIKNLSSKDLDTTDQVTKLFKLII
ncbi:glycosyltransferase [Rossellomorea aquimaris]|uniref:glycosyltransferase n=1 Tax=Rossellomorea aquimaris TaxID=189382 RepID=UPI001CD76D3C|nr:glycosyltransferase [Rossellomorea aquimaris]MCA1061476.1 glycosyltransferase [Rossellomorea aquimaris]